MEQKISYQGFFATVFLFVIQLARAILMIFKMILVFSVFYIFNKKYPEYFGHFGTVIIILFALGLPIVAPGWEIYSVLGFFAAASISLYCAIAENWARKIEIALLTFGFLISFSLNVAYILLHTEYPMHEYLLTQEEKDIKFRLKFWIIPVIMINYFSFFIHLIKLKVTPT